MCGGGGQRGGVRDEYLLPKVEDVDNEDWMILKEDVGDNNNISPEGVNANNMDVMLKNFQNFMIQPSNVLEGVVTNKATAVTAMSPSAAPRASKASSATTGRKDKQEQQQRIEIRPRIFMNILHAVLKGTELNFPATENEETTDPFFFKEDYDMMDESDGDDDDDMGGEVDETMKSLMVRFCMKLSEKLPR